jgi:hypothetical protein
VGRVGDGVREPGLWRVFDHWREVDERLGDRIAHGVESG